jgi:hypothetical protein
MIIRIKQEENNRNKRSFISITYYYRTNRMVRKSIENDWRQAKVSSVGKGYKHVAYSFLGVLLPKTSGDCSD